MNILGVLGPGVARVDKLILLRSCEETHLKKCYQTQYGNLCILILESKSNDVVNPTNQLLFVSKNAPALVVLNHSLVKKLVKKLPLLFMYKDLIDNDLLPCNEWRMYRVALNF